MRAGVARSSRRALVPICKSPSVSAHIGNASSQLGKRYEQQWTENMSLRGEPEVTELKGSGLQGYTRVAFEPDLPR